MSLASSYAELHSKPKLDEEELQIWKTYANSVDNILRQACASPTKEDSDSSHRRPHYFFDALEVLCEAGHADLAHDYLLWESKRWVKARFVEECWKATGLAGSTSCSKVKFDEVVEGASYSKATVEVLMVGALETTSQAIREGVRRLCGPIEAFYSQAPQYAAPSKKPIALGTTLREFRSHASMLLLKHASLPFQELLQRWYYWKLLEFFKAASELSGEGSLLSILAYMETGEDSVGQEYEDEEELFEFDDSFADRRWDSTLLSMQPSLALMPRLTAALTLLNLQDVNQLAYEGAMCQATDRYVTKRTRGELSRSVLRTSDCFPDVIVLPFLSLVLGKDLVGKAAVVDGYRLLFGRYIRSVVGQLRIADIFDIVTDFPESADAVADLQECMRHSSLQKRLVRGYCNACASRLHIPGAKTTDIIEFYVHSIRILRQLDPTGILLEAVSAPTREYLQSRRDAIRCIVSAMTDDSPVVAGESLFDELQRPAEEEEDDEEQEDDAFALRQSQTWSPEPVNADIRNTARAQRMHDIISMLVHIYGSKDLFINEYRGMLAERLLAKPDFDTDTEVRTLEHLKKRFGENNLHSCEVMMKDLADSKRLYNTIRAMPNSVRSPRRGRKPVPASGIGPASATIISALYWPPLQPEAISLPEMVESFLDEYADKFFVAKAPRKLVWMRHLGSVDLSLTVHGVCKDFSVSPFEASILMAFQNKASWTDEMLAGELGTNIEVLRRKASFWVKHSVLSESQVGGKLTYMRATELSSGEAGEEVEDGPIAMEEDEGGSALLSQEEQLKQEMSMYEQYIMGMLTNFEAGLPLDRIHNMLKMFVPDQAYDKNIDQLAAFLGQLVGDEKLCSTGNVYTKQA